MTYFTMEIMNYTDILIIYSELFVNFLTTVCDEHIYLNLNFKFDEFKEHFNLKIIDVPGDGLCFISTIRLFLYEFKNRKLEIDNIEEHFINF